jgi:hypothetical protein
VTKSIRGKAIPIETQLHNARNLIDGITNVFLPNKPEFVLDWLLEKLRYDKKTEYAVCSETDNRKTADVQAELWRLLYDVWIHKDLDNISKETSFGKQNFSAILQDALRDLENRPVGEREKVLPAVDRFLGEIIRSDSDLRLRPHLEQATLLFGMALNLINLLPNSDRELGTRFLVKITQVFRTILYDDGQTKKVYHLKFLAHSQACQGFFEELFGTGVAFSHQ